MAPLVGQTVSHYRILEHLGGGGMGVVYKAQDLKLDRPTALKFLPPDLTRDPEAKERFVHEAKAASALDHQNICNVHEIGETDDGQLFIVMAYYEGETLKKKIERGPLKIDDSVDIAIQLAQGLAKAHEHGIIHRDIKPANIMVTTDGVAKIVDFGLAKLSGSTLLTKTGSTLGTAAYMSPEQAQGETVDQRTDVWSLGVVLYEMLTGKRPFDAEYQNALFYSISNSEPDPVTRLRTGVPLELERIVRKCLSKTPHDRYQHADEIAVDLRAVTPGSTPAQPPTFRSPAAGRIPRRTWILISLGAVAVAAAAGWFLLGTKSQESLRFRNKSVAVLPVSPFGRSFDDTVFAEGMHDDILTQLSKIGGLRIIARTTMVLYRDSRKTPRQIGDELDAGYVLESSARRTNGKIRISAQLISAADEGHVWAEVYDRDEADRFAVQSDIAKSIASALQTTLTRHEEELLDRRPTRNMEAYEYYLRANYFWEIGWTQGENERAVEMYEKAVSLDPEFALAYARLSKVQSTLIQFGGFESPDRIAKARAALERAVALAPDLGEVHLAEGEFYWLGEPDSQRAFVAYQRAVETEPNNPEILFSAGSFLLSQGKVKEANELLVKMAELNPAGSGIFWAIASNYFLRNFAEAERWSNIAILRMPRHEASYNWKWNVVAAGIGDTARGRAILDEARRNTGSQGAELQLRIAYFSRDFATVQRLFGHVEFLWWNPFHSSRSLAYEISGHHDSAMIAARAEVLALEPRLRLEPLREDLHIRLALAHAILGIRAQAIGELDRAMRPGLKIQNWGRAIEHGAAIVQMVLGDQETAIARLEYLRSISSMVNGATLRLHPIYDPLRNNPRFQSLLAKEERTTSE